MMAFKGPEEKRKKEKERKKNKKNSVVHGLRISRAA